MGIGLNTRMPYYNMLQVILPANNRNEIMAVSFEGLMHYTPNTMHMVYCALVCYDYIV